MASSITASAALLIAVAEGALAASFLISNQETKLSADRTEGIGAIQYGAFDKRYDGKVIPVLVSGFAYTKITGACQSLLVRDAPLVGTFTVKITTERLTARDAYSDLIQDFSGTSTAKDAIGGVAAGATTKEPGIRKGDNTDPASAAQEAGSVLVLNSKQIAVATSVTISTSSGRSVRFYKGFNECF
ncbi:DUF6230 family protein [Streptomyces sp. NPDC056661]|uniref:DUF6230 family protein n=1 Tax=Streptomyces sp. NPDC056661 TaxID=3345898 RepID=UPI0036C47094